jgi:hypothetical protein
MSLLASSLPVIFAVVAAPSNGCHHEPAQTAPTTPSSAPAASGMAAPDADDIGAAKYAVCSGQGGNARQLSPAFLDRMDACASADVAPADSLAARAGDGEIIAAKGDCQYGQGISCHFHTSMEFVAADHRKDDAHAVGEVHCIVPSANASSPTVYGAHVRCKAGTTPDSSMRACSHELLQLFDHDSCHQGWKCCDNGTLTKPVAKQSPAELKLRPDFRICEDAAIEVDCGLFHAMHGHTANVVGLGEEYDGSFNSAHQVAHH